MFKTIKEGQKVWVKRSDHYREKEERNPVPATVEKVGIRYFYLKEFQYSKYLIENGLQSGDTNYIDRVFYTLQEIEDVYKREELWKEIKKSFQVHGEISHSLKTLEKVKELLKI
jgi:hypothetical protein